MSGDEILSGRPVDKASDAVDGVLNAGCVGGEKNNGFLLISWNMKPDASNKHHLDYTFNGCNEEGMIAVLQGLLMNLIKTEGTA